MRFSTFLPIALLGSAVMVAYKKSRAGYESADYTVVVQDGDFEVRHYPDLLLASTPMSKPTSRDGSSFTRLFRYIAGANEAEQKISMTTPVLTTRGGTDGKMSFVVPKDVAERGPPAAKSADVELETRPGGRFAVYRFTGGWAPENFDAQEQRLLDWVRTQGLNPVGRLAAAGYDPPFVPPFLRRNEVLVRLDQEATTATEDASPSPSMAASRPTGSDI